MSGADDILYCDVGHDRFAFRSRDVRHVERAEQLRPAPGEDGRAGVLMLGDHAVPVFSLGAALGLPGDRLGSGPDRHIAVTGDRQSLVGWLVDRVARADQSGAFQVAPLPPLIGSPANRWFEGAVRIDDERSALLIRPQCLNPLVSAPAPPTGGQSPFGASPQFRSAVEPVAVVFESAALPPSAARRYALSGRQTAAIVQTEPSIAVSGCLDHVRGAIWWRRSIVPVIDFNHTIDRGADTERRRLIARCGARHHGALVALSIAAEVVMCRGDSSYRELRDVECPWFASGIFDINGEPVALLDLDVLLEPRSPGPLNPGAGDSGFRDGDAVLPDLLVERAPRDAEPVRGALDPPAFGP